MKILDKLKEIEPSFALLILGFTLNMGGLIAVVIDGLVHL